MTGPQDELLADGEALLSRREAVEQTIAREFRKSRAALLVQAAQVERQREQVRVELLRIVTEFDEAGEPGGDEEGEEEAGEARADEFYAARERLAARDRELCRAIEALHRRAAELREARVPPKLAELEREREQLETLLRHWRARCRRAGFAPSLPRWGEFAGVREDD